MVAARILSRSTLPPILAENDEGDSFLGKANLVVEGARSGVMNGQTRESS